MINLQTGIRESQTSRKVLPALCLLTLALFVGCATDGTTTAKPAASGAPAVQNIPLRGTVANQLYQILYTVKTNSMVAAAKNLYPPAKLPDNCQEFLNSLADVSPDMQFRFEFEPFVQNLSLVDTARPGACYGSPTNKIYLFNAGKLITDANSQGAGWVIPIGPNAEKAVFVHTSIGPQRTTIMVFDDPLHGHLVYDSFASAGDDRIDYICGVEVVNKNRFYLHEGRLFNIPAGMVPPRALWPRTFIVSVNEELEVNLEQ